MGTNKSFSSETSERYSRALFEVANESKELDNIENEIRNFQILFNASKACFIKKILSFVLIGKSTLFEFA